MAQPLRLEDFETDTPSAEFGGFGGDTGTAEPLRSYEDGFADGQAAAAAAQDHGIAALVQGLVDLDFTYAEARRDIMAGLAPLIRMMVDKLLPHLAQELLAEQIAILLQERLEAQSRSPITLTVHPDQHMAIAAAVAEGAPRISCAADPDLPPGGFRLRQDRLEVLCDPDRLITEIAAVFAALYENHEKDIRNG